MPLIFDSSLTNYLQSPTLELAYLWLLTRADGTQYFFTSYETDIVYGGETYLSRPGLDPFSIDTSTEVNANSTDLEGFLLESEQITETDIANKMFSGAILDVYLFCYSDLTIVPGHLYSGRLGDVTFGSSTFRAEVRSLIAQTEVVPGLICGRGCNAKRLGDSDCHPEDATWINSFRITTATVTAVTNNIQFTTTSTGIHGSSDHLFQGGYFKWLTGNNAGLETEIRDNVGSTGVLTLAEPMFAAIQVGDTFTCDQGCNRLIGTCLGIYNNAINFQGEPYTPGLDALLAVV